MGASEAEPAVVPQSPVDTVIQIKDVNVETGAQLSPPGSPSKLVIPKLTISWQDLCFNVKVKNPETKKFDDKAILKNVSGEALPGELLVLMGPSGAGKSTLLDCISGRNRSCKGEILVNGKPWSRGVAKHASYVMQDDLFYANLTVLEHLTYQAQLRMEKTSTAAERRKRVTAIISELGLTKVTNTPIGDMHVKGLSGGQRKRLSVATELLTNPSLLFVDEPTSGLDSFMAEAVILQLQALARKGRTVIATIHQPSSDLFQLFDKLYLLADGTTIYNGKAADSVEYFASVGMQCPPFMNPTDFFMKQLVVMDDQPDSKSRVQNLVAFWTTHEKNKGKPIVRDVSNVNFDKDCEDFSPGLFTQVSVLVRRNTLRLLRDTIGFKARIGSTLFISIMVGLIFLRLTHDQKGIQNFTGAMFFIAVNQFFSSANPEFISVPLEIPLILREHRGRLYNVITWYVAKNVSELPFQLFFPMLFQLPMYWMVGFTSDFTMFFSFYLIITLLSSCATGVGYLVSCLAKRVDVAPIIGILFILPFLLFGGLFLNSDSTPVYFIWLQQVSPIKYAFHALMRAYWSTVDSIPCPAGVPCMATKGTTVLALNSVAEGEMWFDCLILLIINGGFRVAGAFFLWLRARGQATH